MGSAFAPQQDEDPVVLFPPGATEEDLRVMKERTVESMTDKGKTEGEIVKMLRFLDIEFESSQRVGAVPVPPAQQPAPEAENIFPSGATEEDLCAMKERTVDSMLDNGKPEDEIRATLRFLDEEFAKSVALGAPAQQSKLNGAVGERRPSSGVQQRQGPVSAAPARRNTHQPEKNTDEQAAMNKQRNRGGGVANIFYG